MRKAVGETLIRKGPESLTITTEDLFDRIINIEFVRKSSRRFTLRSDYEPVYHKDGTISFKTCAQKPDIKISYKQVAESVAIEVDIEITNLFIGDGDKESIESMNTAEGDPVQWCTVQMGYRKQFPDWRKAGKTTDLTRFWDISRDNITNAAEPRRGSQINVQILTGYTKSYPPDKVTYFKGILGTFEHGLYWQHTKEDLKAEDYGDKEFPEGLSDIERVLFQFITRCFIRPGIRHLVETTVGATNEEAISNTMNRKYAGQRVRVYEAEKPAEDTSYLESLNISDRLGKFNKKAYVCGGESRNSFLPSHKAPAVCQWTYLELVESGVMSVKDANEYGIICHVSRTLQGIPANFLYGYGLTVAQAKALGPVSMAQFGAMMNTFGGQLVALQCHYPFIRWYALPDGNFYFYHERDTDEDLRADPFIKKMQKENLVFLPAVYDITPSGTRTIRCPFTSFISPMTTVIFQSRHSIGSLVGYYYPPKTNAYLVITAAIEFATVTDANTMELMCVDVPPNEVKVLDTGDVYVEGLDDPPVQELPKRQERPWPWLERVLTIAVRKTEPTNTSRWWAGIVSEELKPSFRPKTWPTDPLESQSFEKLALEALKEWNPEYFDPNSEYMARSQNEYGFSNENAIGGIGGRTGIKVCWLKPGDKIVVRYPFQAEYPPDSKITEEA
jgi:hypothetical protein